VPDNNPIAKVATDLVKEAYVLCFDEFQVVKFFPPLITF
jgi:predicted ATPase